MDTDFSDALRWQLGSISPLDGRYRAHLAGLGDMVGESALIGYRLYVEAQWLLHLDEYPELKHPMALNDTVRSALKSIKAPMSETRMGASESALSKAALPKAASMIKEIEQTTNHDVKAVEYYLRDFLTAQSCSAHTLAFIHFGCTSEDINNLSYALMLRDLRAKRLVPLMDELLYTMGEMIDRYAALPMLARTHGQTASPTTLGKELAVFARRLLRQRQRLGALPIEGKCNGAVGNYNAHAVAFPGTDWQSVARTFVRTRLGLAFNPLTTQIENHDSLVEVVSCLHHFNTILLGFCRDMWSYISIGYFRQGTREGEVGSSTMPHKVNPIDFENAEGNLGLANALGAHFAEKLPISRWQRDLSDSTVLRSLGSFVGHCELAWRSVLRGLGKVEADVKRLNDDLEGAWEVLAEPIQTVMRRHGVVDAYERLKAATRGRDGVTREALTALIMGCEALPPAAKTELKALTPSRYTGLAERLAREFLAEMTQGIGSRGEAP